MSGDEKNASLLSKKNMGGINGGKGYKAQDAYLCIKLPRWFDDPTFSMFLNEGGEDIDISFQGEGKAERHSYQIKDHLIKRSDLPTIVQSFKERHEADSTLNRFILVGGGLHEDVKSFQVALERTRRAEGMYGGTPTGEDTRTDLIALLNNLKLPITADWALRYLDIEDSEHIRTWPNSAESLRDEFVGKTWKIFSDAQQPGLSRAFEALHFLISSSTGQTMTREDVMRVLKQAISEYAQEAQETGLSLFLDVWGDQDARARDDHDAVLRWHDFFDREPRQIATQEQWAQTLLPELQEIQRRFRDSGTNRQVTVRGGAPLSVGFAVGAAFSRVKQYQLSVDQNGDLWSMAAQPSNAEVVLPQQGVEMLDPGGEGLSVEISGVRSVRRKVQDYEDANSVRFAARLEMRVDVKFWTASDAVKIVGDLQSYIKDAVDQYGFSTLHLFFALPLGAAVLLGHCLNSVGIVQTYEEQHEGGYIKSARIVLR